MIDQSTRYSQFAQNPNQFRQWGIQIASELRQTCQQVAGEAQQQVNRNADQLQRLTQIFLQTCAAIADQLEAQVQISEAQPLQTQRRAALSPLQRAGVGTNAFDQQATGAVAQALEDQLQSMQNESEPTRRGAVR